MAQYDSARALAQRLIRKKGRSGVELVRSGAGTPSNPNRPWKLDAGAAADPVIATVSAVFLSPVEARGEAGQFAFPVFQRGRADLDDSVSSEATHFVYVAELDIPEGVDITENAVGLIIKSDGVSYAVLRAQSFKPGDGRAVLHIFSVKG